MNCTFFNIVKEFVYFPSCLAIMPVASPYARNNIHQYRIPFAHCDALKYSIATITNFTLHVRIIILLQHYL